MKVEIDCTSRMLYASYYIEGLYEVFGRENVRFSRKPFLELQRAREEFAFEHYFAFITTDPVGKTTRYIVDFCDPPDINETAYDWCDLYGKINFNRQLTDERLIAKIISLPPGFGIRVWNLAETFGYAFSNFLKCMLSPIVSYKKFFHDYYLQCKRPALSEYENVVQENSSKYVFMIATLWENDETTNRFRKLFLETAKAAGCNIEGGFLASADNPKYDRYKEWIFNTPYAAETYLAKTKKSKFVFNTPAVHGCHGWKLGEFMAMGKAVISTPLTNELPLPLNHGKQIHLVSGEGDLREAVELLMKDESYCAKLGRNIKDYYKTVAKPAAVIRLLMNHN